MLEIELKARIKDFETIFQRIKEGLDEDDVYPFKKVDIYYTHPTATMTRIRAESCKQDPLTRSFDVTRKIKTLEDGIEVSNEMNFSVDGFHEFEEFLLELGFSKSHEKSKVGFAVNLEEGVLAELSHVAGLGDFLELEILAPLETPTEEVAAHKSLLLKTLQRLGLSEMDIEPRSYTALLQDAKASSL